MVVYIELKAQCKNVMPAEKREVNENVRKWAETRRVSSYFALLLSFLILRSIKGNEQKKMLIKNLLLCGFKHTAPNNLAKCLMGNEGKALKWLCGSQFANFREKKYSSSEWSKLILLHNNDNTAIKGSSLYWSYIHSRVKRMIPCSMFGRISPYSIYWYVQWTEDYLTSSKNTNPKIFSGEMLLIDLAHDSIVDEKALSSPLVTGVVVVGG